jgi:hypothetical protein
MMTDGPQRSNRRQFWGGVALLLVLAGLLIADKAGDNWDGRGFLFVGAIALWAIGPALAGAVIGARVFSRSGVPRRARRGAFVLSLAAALLAAAITVPFALPKFGSEIGLVVLAQVMAGTMIGGFSTRYAEYLCTLRSSKDVNVPHPPRERGER